MIPKLICFIFGHERHWYSYTGETAKITDRLTGNLITVPVRIEKDYSICPRCGESIER